MVGFPSARTCTSLPHGCLRSRRRFPVIVESLPQHIIKRQFPNILGWHPEDRHPEIAAFYRWRPVMKMHRAFVWLDDPVVRVIESNQTAVKDANRISVLTLPGVVVFEFEL